MIETIKEPLIIVSAAVLRSVLGWMTVSIENLKRKRKIPFDYHKLLSTVIRVSVIGFATYYGLEGYGMDVEVLGVAASSILTDKLFKAMKETKSVTKII